MCELRWAHLESQHTGSGIQGQPRLQEICGTRWGESDCIMQSSFCLVKVSKVRAENTEGEAGIVYLPPKCFKPLKIL